MLLDFDLPAIASILLALHCLIGLAAALIAKRKGFNFSAWLIFGLIGGTAALIAAIVKQKG